jgi:dihydroorotate dehydrogenase electron transfer subunit
MLIAMSTTTNARRGMYTATIRRNERLCDEHYQLELLIADFPPSTPGQFIELHTQPAPVASGHPILDWAAKDRFPQPHGPEFISATPLLRRPYSIAGHDVNHGTSVIRIIYRVIGKMTQKMEALRIDDEISVLGPLGNGFSISDGTSRVILVGGGVGIPPMLYLGRELAQSRIPAMALIGVQKNTLLPLKLTNAGPSNLPVPLLCVEEFAQFGISSIITTDDGSLGVRGRVTSALDAVLSQLAGPGVVVCCCGPSRMMQATAEVSEAYNVPCYASLEQPMACGMGTCQSCIIKFKPPGSAEWVYKLTCSDGPVFNTRDIIWK